MSSIQEQQFYLQLWTLTTGPAVKVMKHFFQVKILNNSKFESFLNDQNNMHTLFHQCFPTIPCCKCVTVSLASSKKRGCLNFRQFDMLYDNSGKPQPNHENITGSKVNQYCLCKYSSKRSIKVSGLDITLFNNIIQHCCPSKMNFMWRQNVKDIRNFLAHAGHGKISRADFESHWKSLETATLGFAGEMGDVCEEMFQDEISRILNSSTDQLRDQLKELIKKSNDDLRNMLDLNGFHPLKTTAEECKTNIQLVHLKQETHDRQLNRIESSTGQSEDILTQMQLTSEKSKLSVQDMTRDIGEVKHRLNNLESIIKVAVVQAIEEEKGKHTKSENRKINIGTQVDSKSWDEENTLRNLSKIVTTEIDRQSSDKEEFHVKSLENKCIQLELVAFPDVFKNAQTLREAVKSLINQLVKAGEIDTYIPGKLEIKLTVKTPLTKEELAVVYSVFNKHEILEESTATEMNVITNLFDTSSITRILKLEPDSLKRSDDQSEFTDKDDFALNQQIKMEKNNEEKYEEIFVNVDNLKCLLKLNGLPNDLNQPEGEEVSPDTEGNQLLYIEWTFECPGEWNLPLIVSSINDNISTFPDEFPVDYVYNETSRTFILHTTAQRSSFRSYSSLEAAVVKLIGKIINVSSIASTEPAELSASVLIMTKPEEGDKFNKEVKTEQSRLGLKDNVVACEHCTQSFSCKHCTSKMNHIRRLEQALKMKAQTIQRLEKALTKREKEAIEEDESDFDSYYSAKKNTINEEPRDYTGNSSTTREIEMSEEPEQKKRKTATTSEIENLEENPTEDGIKSLNHLVVDMKQALQKLGEIPLLDNCIAIYRKYMRKVKEKVM
ncbi:Hypothetical predicted protein [Mytilus galloprovincialis]|uniref:DZIP3-like HEPN domain-containing protein n=1 Tax=Mytilus galloprovincialis TaxID=29158 RepID=A0A8B6GI67_MYTGA|nr:Hypothetical predicted protein [Mytilus galloprovincialis]